MGWDPSSMSYRPSRVRENEANERRIPDPLLDIDESSDWPSNLANKCSVRSKHLPNKLNQQIANMVSPEVVLYKQAKLLSEAKIKSQGSAFTEALMKLKHSNEQLKTCLDEHT